MSRDSSPRRSPLRQVFQLHTIGIGLAPIAFRGCLGGGGDQRGETSETHLGNKDSLLSWAYKDARFLLEQGQFGPSQPEEQPTPFLPMTSSASAWMHMNLMPPRVIPFASPHSMS